MEALENQIRQICHLYFEDWQPKLIKQPVSLRAFGLVDELLVITSVWSLISFFYNRNFFFLLLGILLLGSTFFIRRLRANLQERNQTQSAPTQKEKLIKEIFTETTMHLTIIEKQHPLSDGEEILLMHLGNISAMNKGVGRDTKIAHLLEEASNTRLINIRVFKLLCQKFQVNVPF